MSKYSKTYFKYYYKTRAEVNLLLAKLTPEERQYVRAIAFNFVDYLEQVQRMPLVLRLTFYRVAFHLYDFLRSNRQLGRHEGAFDTEMREAIRSILSENLDDYYDE